ncbi:MAG: WD40 repeat domain-containing protein [Verrucomicrobia bacterium]|nr:WD40 repeat domain-containing protein [Verrucomicrobiota bacterium]
MANLATGTLRQSVVAWHPDGELLAAGGSDPRIQIWNVPAKRKVAVLEGHFQQVNFLNFHWSGEMLASMSWDGSLRLWQPSPGRLLMRLHSRPLDFSQPGRWAGIISPSNQQAQLWGVVPSREYQTFLNTFREGESVPREGDISPDGTLLALAASDGVRLWDVARGREVAWLRMGDTTSAAFRADGRALLTCGPTDGLRRWPIDAGTNVGGGWQMGLPRVIQLPFAPTRMTRSRDDRTLAVAGENAGQVLQLDLATELVRGTAMSYPMAAFVAVSGNADRLAAGGWHSHRVKVWDGSDGRLLKEWNAGSAAQVFFTPDQRELVVARDKSFVFLDLNSLVVTRRLPREAGLYPGHIAFTSDGKLMALEMAPGVVHLQEIASGRTIARLEDPHGDQSTWMSFTPDGTQLIVVARYPGAIHRWDLRAIRARLKPMNLDWDWPEFSAPSPGEGSLAASPRPIRVQVASAEPSFTNAPAASP